MRSGQQIIHLLSLQAYQSRLPTLQVTSTTTKRTHLVSYSRNIGRVSREIIRMIPLWVFPLRTMCMIRLPPVFTNTIRKDPLCIFPLRIVCTLRVITSTDDLMFPLITPPQWSEGTSLPLKLSKDIDNSYVCGNRRLRRTRTQATDPVEGSSEADHNS